MCMQQDIGTLKYNRHNEKDKITLFHALIHSSHSYRNGFLVVIEGGPTFDNIYPMSDFGCMYSKVLATMSLEEK